MGYPLPNYTGQMREEDCGLKQIYEQINVS